MNFSSRLGGLPIALFFLVPLQPEPWNGPRFPRISMADQVRAQHELCCHLEIHQLYCVVGWSMGAGQSYQWAVSYPEMVHRSLEATLELDPEFKSGWYSEDTRPTAGLRAFARIYAGWGFSQSFYREKLYQKMGYETLDSFLIGFWEGLFLKKDANNLLSMLWTWVRVLILLMLNGLLSLSFSLSPATSTSRPENLT